MSYYTNPLMTIPAHQQVIRDQCVHPSGTFSRFRKEEIEQSIPARFEQQVARYPDRLAVKTEQHTLTYAELNQAANHIAHAILAQQGSKEEPIALLLEQGLAPIIAIFGILKAGKSYVPLDPKYPRTRTSYIVEDSGVRLIITNTQNRALASEIAQGKASILNIDTLDTSIPAENPVLSLPADRLAYIMYTSGSTGQPKGVVDTHRNVLHHIMRLTNEIHMCLEDRQTLLRSCSFNGSVRDIFGSLLNGASLHIFNLEEEEVGRLASWLMQEEITIFRAVISLYRSFVSTLTDAQQFPHLRLIHVGGEPVNSKDVELFQRYFSECCLFISGLGITETGHIRNYFVDKTTQIPSGFAPVGYAVEDMEILLLDETGQAVGANQIGEIVVKSRYLSPGYWRRPDLTQAKFLPDPEGGEVRMYLTGDLGMMHPDGCLVHLGRKDFQVKIRGHRVEAGEIEKVLLNLDMIKEAVVVALGDRPENQRLVAYLVPMQQSIPTVTTLRRTLADKLPDYMIPAAFVWLESLPLTATGKVDRQALPAPDLSRPTLETPFVAPRTPTEQTISEIWEQVLGLDQIGIHDHFLDLGGHSLLATQVLSRVYERFQVELPIQSLFAKPTIANFAQLIEETLLGEIEPLADDARER